MAAWAGFNTNRVWERIAGEDQLGAAAFNLIVTASTVYGLLLFGGAAALGNDLVARHRLNGWGVLSLIAGSLVGCFVSQSSTPVLSSLGLSTMAGCLGAMSGPMLAQYKGTSLTGIAIGAIVVTLALGAAGTVCPKSLQSWGSLLCTALAGLIALELSTPGAIENPVIHWAGVILFSGYIVYDFNRAQRVRRTVTNGIHVGVAIFLDLINLFVDLLKLMGSKKEEQGIDLTPDQPGG